MKKDHVPALLNQLLAIVDSVARANTRMEESEIFILLCYTCVNLNFTARQKTMLAGEREVVNALRRLTEVG